MKIVSYNIAKCVQTKIDHILRMNADLYILPECADSKSIVLPKGYTMFWTGDDDITRVRDNILKSKEQKTIQPTKGGHKMVTCQNYVSLFYCQITSCPLDGGIS